MDFRSIEFPAKSKRSPRSTEPFAGSGEAIGNQGNVGKVPNPATFTIWLALAEIFRFKTDGLKEKLSSFVGVIVSGDDGRFLFPGFGLREKVFGFQIACFKNGFRRATGMTVKKDLFFFNGNRKTRFLVLMGRAFGLPTIRVFPDWGK